MKVIVISLLGFLLLQLATAQDVAINGISRVTGIDVMVVEEALDSLSYDADLKKLNFVSKNAELGIENWSDDWLVARMSGPFEMVTLYEKTNEDVGLDESSFLLFIGNDIPLKLTWLPEFEGKIKTSQVVGGELELTYNDQTYLLSPNEITPLENNLCTYLMALNESQSSDIMGNKTSEWRFDVALFKCDSPTTE